jgi:predicted DCC family thiol-disulfide oxidoreductase YuxK
MPEGDMASAPQDLVLYDGTCGLCSRTVQWVIDADRDGRFHFAPLQGATAEAVRARHPDLPADLDSVLYVDRSAGDERVYVCSDAVFRIARRLGRMPFWLAWLSHLPRWLTDVGYRAVARGRHHLFASCPLPTAVRARFLP